MSSRGKGGKKAGEEKAILSSRGKSQQLIHDLRERILSGELPEKYRFETMPALAARLKTTGATLDKVFAVLQREGLVTRINGKGIFVAGKCRRHYVLIFDRNAECGAYGHKSFFVQTFREECKKRNFRFTVFENVDSESDCLEVRLFLQDNPCDAIGLASRTFAEGIDRFLRNLPVPVIGLYRYIALDRSVTYSREWLPEAFDRLRHCSCNSTALIAGEAEITDWDSDLSYRERALTGHLADEEDIYCCVVHPREGYRAALDYLDKNPSLPCGIISTDSILTLGIISAVLQKGLQVMRDVILISHINRGSILAEFPIRVLNLVCNIPDQVNLFFDAVENPQSGHVSVPVSWDDSALETVPEKLRREVTFPTGHVDGVPYFMPPPDLEQEQALIRIAEQNAHNRQAAKTVKSNSGKVITGSFIYAHPPDYKGLQMLKASASDWREVFRRLKRMNMDTVIFQAALWKELNECFYHSAFFSGMTQHKVLEKMLEAAELEDMRVFLGGYGSCSGWQKNFSDADLRRELENHRRCFQEIRRIGNIAGMYFPAETAFSGKREPQKEKRMHELYRFYSSMVKDADAGLKVLISPVSPDFPGKDREFLGFWRSILENSGVDVLIPQDSVGGGGYPLERLPALWINWKKCADGLSLDLWANIELFERRGYAPKTNLVPADSARVLAQIAQAAPYVQRLVCWEAMYFASDAAGKTGTMLRKMLEKGI